MALIVSGPALDRKAHNKGELGWKTLEGPLDVSGKEPESDGRQRPILKLK